MRANLVVHITVTHETASDTDTPAPPLRCVIGELYSFEPVRTPHGWRFSRVETTPVWLSGTRPPTPAPAA
jgi:hypothetical protein